MYYLRISRLGTNEVTASSRAGKTYYWESKPLTLLRSDPAAYAPLNNSGAHLRTPCIGAGAIKTRIFETSCRSGPPFDDIVAPSPLIFHFTIPFARAIHAARTVRTRRKSLEEKRSSLSVL